MKGYSKNHHAHIVQLNRNVLERALVSVEKEIILLHKDEECYAEKLLFDSLKIKQARKISSAAENKNTSNERRIFLIGFNAVTREAQNSLLKTLEEPPAGTSFVLLVPTSSILLKTIQSRCIAITLECELPSEILFLKASYNERLEQIKIILEDKEQISAFYAALEREIKERISSSVRAPDAAKILTLLFAYKHTLTSNSTSSKYLLEEIALRLPPFSDL
jgi:DNA polymerase III delta prime subunit